MTSLNIALVDDESLARQRLCQLLDDVYLDCPHRVIGQYDSAKAFWLALPTLDVDVLILDINMPGMSGLECAEKLKQYQKAQKHTQKHTQKNVQNTQDIAIIFCTADANFALQAFEYGVVDYLLKPLRAERLLQALNKVKPNLDFGKAEKVGKASAVGLAEIAYWKAEQKTVSAYTVGSDGLLSGEVLLSEVLSSEILGNVRSLSQLETQWGTAVLRVHRSYLVPVANLGEIRIDAAGESTVLLHCGVAVPVSRRMLPLVQTYLSNRIE